MTPRTLAKHVKDHFGSWLGKNMQKLLVDVLSGAAKREDLESMDGVRQIVQKSYGRISMKELRLMAADAILGGHGVEAVFSGDFSVTKPVFEYVNMGDTYNSTVIWDNTKGWDGDWRIGDWGSFVELLERRGIKFE